MATTEAVCTLCSIQGPAVFAETVPAPKERYATTDIGLIANSRFGPIVGGYALLHHDCRSRQGVPLPVGGWWACRLPDRQLDELAHFDLYCDACAERWRAQANPDSSRPRSG